MKRLSSRAICLSVLILASLLGPFHGPFLGPAAAAGVAAPRPLPVGPERMRAHGLVPVAEGRRQPVNPLTTSNLLFEEDQPIGSFDRDRSLSRQCRAGRFRQQREHLFIVRLGGIIYGAVIGGFWGLYDPDRLAVPNLVYAVRGQDTGRCEVFVLRHLTPR